MAKEKLTRQQVRERYLVLEKEGKFDQHVDPIDMSIVIPVENDYHYYPVGLREHLVHAFRSFFVVKPFLRHVNNQFLETSVTGRENLQGIKAAIVTSNHVQMFDCVALKKAMEGHYLNIIAANFNNFVGPLGDGMRAAGMLPLPAHFEGMRNFNSALSLSLANNHYVLVFPEQSEWWYYPKIRPFKDGAFYYAAKNNVPVIPCFITFAPRKHKINDPEGMYPQRLIVNILKPIYPDPLLSCEENRDRMRETDFAQCKAFYESFYGKPLSYSE